MSFKFIHAADIHLDSPLAGLERYEGAPVDQVRAATRRALTNLVNVAIAERVAFVLIAGDLYDGDWRDYSTGLFFVREMSRLREADILVLIIAGNHDAQSQITKALRLPENVRLLSEEGPETVIDERRGVVIHGQSFARRVVTDDLSVRYPVPLQDLFNIGLLHTSADGREGHEPYAPCRPDALVAKGYQYWALGHVHKREILHEDPWVLFCGNLQGRSVRETDAKGCTLVAVEGGQVQGVEHRDIDVVRWALCDVDASGAEDGDALLDRLSAALAERISHADGRVLGVRVRIVGPCKAHRELVTNPERWRNEIRARATDLSAGNAWVEKIEFDTSPDQGVEDLSAREDAVGGLLRAIEDLPWDAELLGALASEWAELKRRLPGGAVEGADGLALGAQDWLPRVLPAVKAMLVSRLLGRGGEA